MFGRGAPAFVACDVLGLEGRELRERPLSDRKKILRRVVPRRLPFVLYADLSKREAATSTASLRPRP